MKEYIFYTTEGYTISPNDENVDNCQVLGRAKGNDVEEAQQNLLKENPRIEQYGFDIDVALSCELKGQEDNNKEIIISYLTQLLTEKQMETYSAWVKSQNL